MIFNLLIERILKMITIEQVVLLVTFLCPDLEKTDDKYIIQSVKVTCMDYYANDIVNHSKKYEVLLLELLKKGE